MSRNRRAPAMRGPVAALSLNTLLEQSGGAETVIDYVKMDIEGAEARVLKENVEWAERARAIKVEVHEPYSVEGCTEDLRRLGFETHPLPTRRGGVTGLRRGRPPRSQALGPLSGHATRR